MADSPLFRSFSRSAKSAARSEFRLSQLGRALSELERKTARKGQAAQYLREIGQKIHQSLPESARQAAAKFDRYSKKKQEQEARKLVGHALTAMGPLGDIIKAFLRPRGKALTPHADKEIQAAEWLLRAFGFEVIPPPPQRGGILPKVQQTAKYLETLGFKVVEPAPGALKGLPGWSEHLRKQGAVTPAGGPTRPLPQRKTVDINIDGTRRRVRKDDPLLTGEMIPVVSSNVHSIGFRISQHPQIGTLLVRFLQDHGQTKVAGPLYEYFNVPTRLFQMFRKAASKGRFVWDKLRIRGTVSGHRFDYKLTGISRGYVPRKATLTPEGEYFQQRSFLGENTRTGERRIFQSRPSMLVRPTVNRGTSPNRGTGFRG